MTHSAHNHHHNHRDQQSDSKSYVDPVCGMSTEDESAFTGYEYNGTGYYFCSDHCLAKFKENPGDYGAGETKDCCHGGHEAKADHSTSTGVKHHSEIRNLKSEIHTYTCPMHPEIVQDEPGSCPKCGMALEARTISLDAEEENPEYDYMWKRFIFGAILTVPLVIIAMREMLPGGHLIDNLASARTLGWWELILATPVVLWAGWPFYVRGVQSIINKSLNMFTLIGLGVSVAYIYSLTAVLFRISFRQQCADLKALWVFILRRRPLLSP